MGTMLQQSGLKLGERPETLCITEPDAIKAVHQQYIDSGSNIVYANTFGANAHKLAGTGYGVDEVITAAIKVAKEVCGDKAKVALDIGPIGEMLEPYGTLSFEGAYDIFKEMIISGVAAGADLVVFETMSDLYEVKAAVLAAKENCDLPVMVTMSFEKSGRTFTGCCVESMAYVLEGLGVDAMGINCSLGPSEILPIARRLSECTDLPIVVKANAGLPDPATGLYNVSPEEFGQLMEEFAETGMLYVGGCCGTSPDYIRALVDHLSDRSSVTDKTKAKKSVVCTPTGVVEIDRVRVIGERINPTGKRRFKQALIENDIDYILNQAIEQMEAGADILDVNVGLPEINEPEMMIRVVKELQAVIDIPLQIDSSDPKAIEAGLRVCNGKPIVNSVNGEAEVLETILPLVKKYGASVVGLTLDSKGIPAKAEERFAIAKRIVDKATEMGIPKEDIYIDCLTLTVSAQQAEAAETLKAVRMVKEQLGVKTVLGVSNISFGLPYRDLINHSFLTLAMGSGLDLPIINPNAESMMNAVMAFNVLNNVDKDSAAYIEKFANYTPASAVPATNTSAATASPTGSSPQVGTVEHAIQKGLKEEAVTSVTKLLETETELTVIDKYLIPALDRVGIQFEKGQLFLPQLLNAAAAASEAFEVIKTRIAAKGSETVSKGKIILATVKGDIHDIGKNIVKVILENYGYTVIDLGKDVDPAVVVETAIQEDVKLIGLSALMTTTLGSMEDTIKALRESGHDCKVMVGGAVLTEDYSQEMGADYYARNAKEGADVAKIVLG
ncbi:MAG: homocysteine S-methyltransferase family protein [Firmicutes bacterium]|nr:homocysteine S-methyltransferase family protein [Bacillota bacterium]